MSQTIGRPPCRRAALAFSAALVLGAALGACTNTIEGAERDARKIFKTEGGSPKSTQNPTSSNQKSGWKNPE